MPTLPEPTLGKGLDPNQVLRTALYLCSHQRARDLARVAGYRSVARLKVDMTQCCAGRQDMRLVLNVLDRSRLLPDVMRD
jgi:hypothetical protein